ncbi:hypothetical protein QC763_600980 [Podospora pseudopauciseta]|uniref:Ubiquitin-like domain-containing protein n=2 Tax=Podospora TaxID=5144 RepID=A0ABR0H4P3_9PEZI|nr:hypothetical protein QC763_600980 [Podospora pseudopauciseta]KAK4671353.1 hypothetical protein QC764_600980 [Podospora pseudoanserina]
MGCCLSREGESGSPYTTGGGASSSARAINEQPQTTRAHVHGGHDGHASGSRRRHRHSQQPLDQHINKPLRLHEWTSYNRTWTSRELRQERIEFFDTRVAGRQEIWQTLHAVLEVLWASAEAVRNGQVGRRSEDDGPSEEDPAIALATAQSILDAADITLPTGDLYNGAYDAFGNYYQLPHHIVADPTNLEWRPGWEHEDLDDTKADLTAGEETTEERDDLEDEAERRREEKGKGVVDVKDLIAIRARLSDGSKDVNVSVGKGDSVRSLARQIAEDANLPPSKKIRIAYMGRVLKESTPLLEQGYKQGHVVNALVFNR